MTKTEIKRYKIDISLEEMYRLGLSGDRMNIRNLFHKKIVDLMFIQDYKINDIKLNSDGCIIFYQEEVPCDNCTIDNIKYPLPDTVYCQECQGSGCIEHITISRNFTNMCSECQGTGLIPYKN
jgi:hypothetical protein